MVLQSLPANAWLLWRFALQSHQFWLGTKSQKSRITQNNFKLITCKLSSIPLSCTIEKKISNIEERGKGGVKNLLRAKPNNIQSFLIWFDEFHRAIKTPPFQRKFLTHWSWAETITFPTKKEKNKTKRCVWIQSVKQRISLHCYIIGDLEISAL